MHHDSPASGQPPPGAWQEEADLASARARAERLEAELARTRADFSRLSQRLSHDVQGVLRQAASFAHYVRETAATRLSARELDYLGRIAAGAAKGASAAMDLTALANVVTADMRPTRLDTATVVAQCVRDLGGGLRDREIQFVLPGGPGPQAVGDPSLVRLALWHLLSNAVKFTRPVPAPRIDVQVLELSGGCRISIQDNGVGFSEEYAHKLFQPFERLHYDTEFEGNGIGLAIVREVVQRHGGRVGAESPREGGARFWIELPPAPAAGKARGPSCVRGHPRRLVVLVDDEPLVLMTIRTLLERDGDEVLTAAGGEAGLDLLRTLASQQRVVDAVISDWTMPGVPGAQVVAAARTLHPAARVVVLTGTRTDGDCGAAIRIAADEVLSKPLRSADLRRALAPAAP
jgi:CheY-like chemotaxis protein